MSSYEFSEADSFPNSDEGSSMNHWDFLTLGLYFVLVMGTGIYSSCQTNRNTVTGYFLAGRFMWWLPIGASLFASNIGSEHFIGLAGSGAAAGIYVGAFEFNALILLQILGWVFLPVFIASGVNTLPEYMHKRYGGRRIQTCLAVFSLLLYVFTKISVNMYSGAIFIQQAFQWSNMYISVCVLVGMTAVLTIAGGLRAVIYTDTLQFFIMIFGSMFVAIKAFIAVGGYENMQTKYLQAIPDKMVANSTCGIPKSDSWVMLRSADPSESDMPWLGFLLGQTPASIWYWCADQMMVQRVMSAKTLSHAQGATIFAGYTKLLPLFVIIMPGMISRILYPNEVGCVDPAECHKFCGAETCTNFAYPKLVFSLMPNGLRGVMLSVMLSALVTDLTSIFNSASTLFTMDIWTLMRPHSTEKEKLLVGRMFIVFLVVFSIAWIPVIQNTQGGELYIYIQAIAAYLSPPIAAVYCLSIIYKRVNETGAFWGLISGFVVGLVRMVLDFSFPAPSCLEQDLRPAWIRNFHYMYFAMLLFWVTIGITIFISLMTAPPTEWMLIRTTYFTRHDKRERLDEVKKGDKTQYEMLQLSLETKDLKIEQVVKSEAERFIVDVNGYEDANSSTTKLKKQTAAVLSESEDSSRLVTLDQETWEVNLLNSMLVVIVAVAVSLYVYFSVNPFTDDQIARLQREKLHQIHLQQSLGEWNQSTSTLL